MKYYLLVILTAIFITACSEESVNGDRLERRQGIMYEMNSQVPFTGEAKFHFENGKVERIENYELGEKHGLFEKYDENGQVRTRLTYNSGKKVVGSTEKFDENGQRENVTPILKKF